MSSYTSFFAPGKIWSGIVSEIRLKNNAESVNLTFFNLQINILNRHENSFQIQINYKKINDQQFKKEYGNIYLLSDNSIKGSDTNGFIDGFMKDKNGYPVFEIYYRANPLKNIESMVSYSGELTLNL